MIAQRGECFVHKKIPSSVHSSMLLFSSCFFPYTWWQSQTGGGLACSKVINCLQLPSMPVLQQMPPAGWLNDTGRRDRSAGQQPGDYCEMEEVAGQEGRGSSQIMCCETFMNNRIHPCSPWVGRSLQKTSGDIGHVEVVPYMNRLALPSLPAVGSASNQCRQRCGTADT